MLQVHWTIAESLRLYAWRDRKHKVFTIYIDILIETLPIVRRDRQYGELRRVSCLVLVFRLGNKGMDDRFAYLYYF